MALQLPQKRIFTSSSISRKPENTNFNQNYHQILHSQQIENQSNHVFRILSAAEAVIAEEHIFKMILKQAQMSTLTTCRLVSRRWKDYSGVELQKRTLIILQFLQFPNLNNPGTYIERFGCSSFSGWPNLSIDLNCPSNIYYKLINLIQNSEETEFGFPCNSFQLITSKLKSPYVQNILSYIGHRIKEFTLQLNQDNEHEYEWSAFKNLKKFLTTQAVNLERLTVIYDEILVWRLEPNPHPLLDPNPDPEPEPELELEAEIADLDDMDIGSESESDNDIPISNNQPIQKINSCFLPNLKILSIDGTVPARMLYNILDGAVNLESFYGTPKTLRCPSGHVSQFGNETFLEYFLEGNGKERKHIFKKLVFLPNVKNVELLERFLLQVTASESDYFALEYFTCMGFHEFSNVRNFWPRVGNIIYKILWNSSNTLRTLELGPLQFIFSTAKISINEIPVMTKLKKIIFRDNSDINNFVAHNQNDKFFPPGFSIQRDFPNVKSIVVKSPIVFNDVFLGRILTENSGPVVSVRGIEVGGNSIFFGDVTQNVEAALFFKREVSRIFPNAVV